MKMFLQKFGINSCPRAKEGVERSERVVVFDLRILITCEDQKTTTPVVFDAFPSFAGGEPQKFFTNSHQ